MPNFVKQPDLIEAAVNAGATKSKLPFLDMLVRGLYSGFVLGVSTTVANQAVTQFGVSFVGAMVFPGGFMLIVFYGWELVTGNMSLIPLAMLARRATFLRAVYNLVTVWCANILGTSLYVAFFYGAITLFGVYPDGGALGKTLIATAEKKTIPYWDHGVAGWFGCFYRAILCNFLVSWAAFGSLVSTSLIGKVVAAWIPVVMFASLGYEHVVVNMFIIPCAMTLGSPITWGQWWWWNLVPATLGNFFGAAIMVAIPMWITWGHEYRKKAKAEKDIDAMMEKQKVSSTPDSGSQEDLEEGSPIPLVAPTPVYETYEGPDAPQVPGNARYY